MTSKSEPSPQDRLAASRQAILRHMKAEDDTPAGQYDRAHFDDASGTQDSGSGRSAWQTIRRAARAWWYHHPAQLALDLGKPVLRKYAEEKPFQLLGISAAAGAAVALLRPWRLMSATGLVVAALKSSQASGLLLSLLTSHPESTTQENRN
jgi:hypothetical protein